MKEADNAATKKKRLGTTGKDPQRKGPSLSEEEGKAIKRKDLLKEEDNAARKKKRLGTTGERPTTKTFEFKRRGRRSN